MRKNCVLCNLQMIHNGDPYDGIRVPRSRNKLILLAQHLGCSLNDLPNFGEHDKFCHRHYDNFDFEVKDVRQKPTRFLIVPDNVWPNRTPETRGILRELPGNLQSPRLPPSRTQRLNPPGPSSSTRTTPPSQQVTDFPDYDMDDEFVMSTENEQSFFDAASMETVDDGLEYSTKKEAPEIPNFLIAEGQQLLALFKFCFDCGTSVTAKKKYHICGTAVIIKFHCHRCNCYKKWRSQSRIGDTKRFSGNVLVASAAVTTPISHSALLQFSKTLGLPMLKWSAFNLVARNTFTLITEEYGKMKTKIIDDILEKQNNGETTKVCADAQFDSRGYSAKQGWETIMCAKTKRVITGHVLENTETAGNSSAMEVEGLRRGLQELSDLGINVSHLTTDRSKSVASMVKAEFPEIVHQWDPWHFIKSVQKDFREATKLKTAPEMIVWLSPILNHSWKIDFNNLLLEKYKNRQVIQPKKKPKPTSEVSSEESATENEFEDDDLAVNDFDAHIMEQIVDGNFPSALVTLFDTERETLDNEKEDGTSESPSDEEYSQEL